MSDEDDLVKAGVEGAVGGIVAPFADLLNKLVGPAAEALGLTLRDQVQFFRLKRYRRLMAIESKPVNRFLDEPIHNWFVQLVEKHKFKNRPRMQHHHDIAVMIDNLTRLGLLIRKPDQDSSKPDHLLMTTLEYEFIGLCQTHL
jgi:hypothetical protein